MSLLFTPFVVPTPPDTVTIGFSAETELSDASPAAVADILSSQSSIIVSGLSILRLPSGSELNYVQKYVGQSNVPADTKRLRRYTLEMMRRMGTPVVIKHMWNDRDVKDGAAEDSPVFSAAYGHTRASDPISHGVGFVSVKKSDNEWIHPLGEIVNEDPGGGAPFAPKYRGYGPGFLTWIIEPDATLDFYKHTPQGVFIRVQEAKAQAPWWPAINDNDLIIHVELDKEGFVVATHERYQAKMGNPVSIRGTDNRGRQEYGNDLGNRRVVNQTFEMALAPRQHPVYGVEVDR